VGLEVERSLKAFKFCREELTSAQIALSSAFPKYVSVLRSLLHS